MPDLVASALSIGASSGADGIGLLIAMGGLVGGLVG